MLTLRYSYNTDFPPGSVLNAYRFASRGADTASPNQHLHAYGLVCTAELAELSAALPDSYYVERARETLACFRQFIARFHGDFQRLLRHGQRTLLPDGVLSAQRNVAHPLPCLECWSPATCL